MEIRKTNILTSIITVDDYIDRKILGHSDEKIASDLFVSMHTLERWKLKVGVKRYHVNCKRIILIREMLKKGMSFKEIASKLLITVEQCRNIFKQFKEIQ